MSKILVVFDFDHSLISKDCFHEQGKLGLSKEEYNTLLDKEFNSSFIDALQYLYTTLKKNGKTKQDLDSMLKSVKITKEMLILLNYLHEKKDKYELIIVTGNSDYPVEKILKNHNLENFFKEIIGYTSFLDEEKLLKITQPYDTDCKNCNPNMCKTFLVKNYVEKNGGKYKGIYFICDGSNDYCLSINLGENDYLFVRKGKSLHKILYEKGMKDNVKSRIFAWDNGEEILDEIKK